MKLRSKLVFGFLFTALAPVLLLSVLLYVYLGRSYQSLNAWQAETAATSFRFYLEGRLGELESAAGRLQSDNDFLIAIMNGAGAESQLAARLESDLATEEYEFALLRLADNGQIVRVFRPEVTIAQHCNFPRIPGSEQAEQSGIGSLGDQGTFAAIAIVPFFYRGELVAQLLVGERLETLVTDYPLNEFDLAALMITASNRVVIARAERQVENLLPQIAHAAAEDQLWLLQAEGHEYLVRSSAIAGITGSNVAQLSFLIDLQARGEAQARLIRLYLLLVVAALLVAVGAGLLLSRRLTRPLTEMSIAARQIARGSVPERIIYFPEDEIGDLVGSVNRLTDDLQATQTRLQQSEQIAAWQMVARQLAHELKNFLMPLTTAVGHLQKLLIEGKTEPARLELLSESIGAEVERMRKLLASFSEFARLPAPQPKPTTIASLVDSVKSAYRARLNDGSLHLAVADNLPPVQCDEEQIRQVFLNLLANSYKAGAAVVELKVERQEQTVLFEIVDNGKGIPAEIDPFAPLYTTKQDGAGLGLAIVRRIIVDHGGEITHSVNPTGGTMFCFTLPVVER